MSERTFRHFDEELDKLRMRLIKMGSVALEQVEQSFHALLQGDTEAVARVIELDTKVDKYDVKIDRLCMRLLALQQPVARDLRRVMTALSLNTTLERIGDLAVNIAERVHHLDNHRELIESSPIPRMETFVSRMLRDAFDCFVHLDVDLARRVGDMDNEVDRLDTEMFAYCIDRMKQDPALIEPASHLIIVSRHAERLADQATNVAGSVIFLVDAKIVKHKNWASPVDAHEYDEDDQLFVD